MLTDVILVSKTFWWVGLGCVGVVLILSVFGMAINTVKYWTTRVDQQGLTFEPIDYSKPIAEGTTTIVRSADDGVAHWAYYTKANGVMRWKINANYAKGHVTEWVRPDYLK